MSQPFDDAQKSPFLREKLLGIGERGTRKSYYPELRERVAELERFRTLLDHSNDAIFLVDADSGIIVDVNRCALEKLGVSREKLLQMRFDEFLSSDAKALCRMILSGNIPKTYVDRVIVELHGVHKPVFLTEMAMRVASFEDKRYGVIVARDIADWIRAEEERRKRLAAMEASMDGMAVIAADGRFIYLNPAHARLFGYRDAHELLGKDWTILFAEKEVERLRRIAERELKRTGSYRGEAVGLTAGREEIRLEVSLNAIEEGAVICVTRDVTERRKFEEMMRHTEKMTSIGGLAAGMAHEINNPLGAILFGVQNVLRRLTEDLPTNLEVAGECGCDLESFKVYLEKRGIIKSLNGITDAGKRAAKIVADMLEFSRGGETVLKPENLVDIVEKSISLAENDYELKKKHNFANISISRYYMPEMPAVVCSANEIEQVLFNLIKNASQAFSAVNHEKKSKPVIIIRVSADRRNAYIEVEDNGPGMDAKTRSRVFEPFFTTKPPGIGTGLGLSVSYFIISKNHDGKIFVESTPGKGSKFVITLPLRHRHSMDESYLF